MTSTQATTWTASGTLALATMTLAVVITTIVITLQDRRHADKRDQLTEAYSIQVILGERNTGSPVKRHRRAAPASAKRLSAIVINHGRYTITGIEAQLWLVDNGSYKPVPFAAQERVPGTKDLDAKLRGGMESLLEGMMHADRLTPWDLGLRFESDPISTAQLPGVYPVVRWADRWGTHWEHRRGEVTKIRDGA
jgi:hypothetical protein